ncbi:hypothetical protein ACFLTH_12595 [Bacteroidota bacterium]
MNKKGQVDMKVILTLIFFVVLLVLISTFIIRYISKPINYFGEHYKCGNMAGTKEGQCVESKAECEDMDGEPLVAGTFNCPPKSAAEKIICCVKPNFLD